MATEYFDTLTTVPPSGQTVYPCSSNDGYRVAIRPGANGVEVTETVTDIANINGTINTRVKLLVGGRGTLLIPRLVYPSAVTVSTPPSIKIFGKAGGSKWSPLYNVQGSLVTQLASSADDLIDGGFKSTIPNPKLHATDRLNSEEIYVHLTIAAVGSASLATAWIELMCA